VNDTIVIVGAGIIGMLCARELLLAGKKVVIIDRQAIGRESSWAGAGILSPLYAWHYPEPVLRLAHWSQPRYPVLTKDLLCANSMDAEWIRSGLLILPPFDRETAVKWCEMYAITHEFLKTDRILEIQPGLQVGPGATALWLADVAQIRNPRLMAALQRDVSRLGAVLQADREITGFIIKSGRLRGLKTANGDIKTESCIVSAGAWTAEILKPTGLELPIRPIRGQIVLLQARSGVLSRILLQDGHYAIPRSDGRILLGSTEEDVGFDKQVTTHARQSLQRWAEAQFPGLSRFPVEQHWAGLRPGTPNGVPIIGKHPNIEGLYICAGHFRNGLVTAPASARLMTDLVLGRSPIFDPSPYAPLPVAAQVD